MSKEKQSDYVKERMDRLLGKTPPLPLSECVKKKLAAMREKGLIAKNESNLKEK